MSSEKRMRCRFWDDKRDDLEEVIALKLSISNLPCQGLEIGKMRAIPSDIGIEIFCECGSAYYWEHWLPRLLEGRNGTFSVHAPFQNLNLSDPNANFEEIRRAYHEAFALCARYGGRHCVCHPYDGKRPENDTLEQLEVAKRCSLERVLQLNQESREYGVELLVENMPQKHGMLDQDGFMELFAPYDELHFLIDTGHANLQAWDLEQMFQRLGDRILAYHINDNSGDWDSHLHAWEGTFPWDTFFAGYTRYTPEAVLVCEYNAGPMERILANVDRIREHVEANMQGKFE